MRNEATAQALPLQDDDKRTRYMLQLVKRYSNALKDPVSRSSAWPLDLHPHTPTTDASPRSEVEAPQLQIPKEPEPQERPYVLHALQEWEGRVASMEGDSFVGILVDATAGEKDESEKAEFSVEDVSPADVELLRVGAIFRWVIGYQVLQSGNRQRVSQLVFRRLPAWRGADLEKAKKKGRALVEALRGGDSYTDVQAGT